MCSSIVEVSHEVSWQPTDKVLWSTTSAGVNVPGSSRVQPLAPDFAPKLGTPRLKLCWIFNVNVFEKSKP
jgi:hypothetical protein